MIGRWELLQAQALSEEMRVRHNLQQWQQLNSDLSDITTWLAQVLPELERLQKIEPPTTLHDMEGNAKELKVKAAKLSELSVALCLMGTGSIM